MPYIFLVVGLLLTYSAFKLWKSTPTEVGARNRRSLFLITNGILGPCLIYISIMAAAGMINPLAKETPQMTSTDSIGNEVQIPTSPYRNTTELIAQGQRMVDEDDTIRTQDKPLLRRAVENVLTNEPKCLQAFTAGKSKDDGRYFVNCADEGNGFNVYFKKKELEQGKALIKPVPFDGVKALQKCRALLKANAQNSSTYDEEGIFGTYWKEFPQGNQHVIINFSVQNGYGAKFNMVGTCNVEPDGTTSVLSVKSQ